MSVPARHKHLHQDPMAGSDRIMLSCEYTGGERNTNALSLPSSLQSGRLAAGDEKREARLH
jgi:hypothetical protein